MSVDDTFRRAASGLQERVMDHVTPTDRLKRLHGTRRRERTLAFAVAAAAAILAIGLPVLLLRGGSGTVADQPTTLPTVPTTAAPPPAETTGASTTTEPEPATTAPATTTAATTTTAVAAPFAGVVSLDPEATLQFGEPSVGFDAEGRPQVVYARTRPETLLATCDDPECTSFVLHDLAVAEGGAGLRIGVTRPNAGPVFWQGGGSDASPAAGLVVCSDPDCSEPASFLGIAEGAPLPAMAVAADGTTLVVSGPTFQTTTVFRCTEPDCAGATTHAAWERPADWWGEPTGAAIRSDGLPVIAFRTETGIMLAGCAEPDCLPSPDGSGLQPMAEIPIDGTVRGPTLDLGPGDEPIASVYTEIGRTTRLVVAACADAECNDWTITEVAEIGDMYSEWDTATGPDGLLRIAWTDAGSLFLASCEEAACGTASIVEAGHPADDVGIAVTPDGAPVIAAQSREHGLALVFCGDDACSIEP